MCAPCPWRVPERNVCFIGRNHSGGLYNQTKDLNVLQVLGLTYGTKMTAMDFYRLALNRITGTEYVCALDNSGLPEYSLWRESCDAGKPNPNYKKGRELLLYKIPQKK